MNCSRRGVSSTVSSNDAADAAVNESILLECQNATGVATPEDEVRREERVCYCVELVAVALAAVALLVVSLVVVELFEVDSEEPLFDDFCSCSHVW